MPPGSDLDPGRSKQTRIPAEHLLLRPIEATGGPGVVVSRDVAAPATTQRPRRASPAAFDGLSTTSSSGEWIVPASGNSTQSPASDVVPADLALVNTSGTPEQFSASVLSAAKSTVLVTGSLAPAPRRGQRHRAGAGRAEPVLVRSSGTMAVSEDVDRAAWSAW